MAKAKAQAGEQRVYLYTDVKEGKAGDIVRVPAKRAEEIKGGKDGRAVNISDFADLLNR
jgi:hypothetical protein